MFSDFIYSFTKDGKLNQKYLKVVHGMSEDVVAKRKKALVSEMSDMTWHWKKLALGSDH